MTRVMYNSTFALILASRISVQGQGQRMRGKNDERDVEGINKILIGLMDLISGGDAGTR